jgi:hypothetical protein
MWSLPVTAARMMPNETLNRSIVQRLLKGDTEL